MSASAARLAALHVVWLLLVSTGAGQQTAAHDDFGQLLGQLQSVSAVPRLATQQGRQDSSEACVYAGLSEVVNSCAPYNKSSQGGGGPREVLTRIIQRCILTSQASGNATKPPMRLLTAPSHYMTLIQPLLRTYSATTDTPVVVDAPARDKYMDVAFPAMQNAAIYNKTHEAWGIYSMFTGVGIKNIKNITNLVAIDRRLNWEGLLPLLRTTAMLYKGEVVGLPVSAMPYLLYYRKDTFARRNISVPRTWKELVTTARQFNGTEGMYGFCGLWSDCTRMQIYILAGMMMSFFQTQGPTQGWLFNADTMELNFNNTAMAEALSMLKGLYAVSPPDNSAALGCPWYSYRFAAGQCLMTIYFTATMKYLSHTSRASVAGKLQGNLGITLWPGSETVYDRATNALVPCTEERCPFATRYTRANGSSYLVNQVPGFDLSMYVLNAHSKPDTSFFTYSVLSYLSSEQLAPILVFSKDVENAPVRATHYDPKVWQSHGWNLNDSIELCRSVMQTFTHPNAGLQLRFPGAMDIYTMWWTVIPFLTAGMSIPSVMNTMMSTATRQLRAIYGNDTDALRAEYYGSLNRPVPVLPPPPQPPAPPVPPSAPLPAPGAAWATQGPQRGLSASLVAVCVAVPTVLLGLAAWLLIRYVRRHSLWRRGHPGHGPFTTLCVTDIEDSTLLWEEVDPLVMDTSVKLHNGCIRNLAAKHGGYESVWEGDSFVVAFHHPSEALSFCMEVQTELMLLPWPDTLLQNDHANEVWCKSTAPGHTATSATKQPHRFSEAGNVKGNLTFASDSQDSGPVHNKSLLSQLDAQRTGALFSTKPSNNKIVHLIPPNRHSTTSYGGSAAFDVAVPAHDEPAASGSSEWTMATYWQSQWVCTRQGTGRQAYKGLRVRLGIHSGVDSQACINFNPTMQRYHYTGPVRVISNAIASAGHGGHTLMSTSVAALLDTDGSGLLTDLPPGCGVYYQGKHVLSGVGEALDLLLVLPDALTCRLALQQARLRSQSTVIPGILSTPIPTAASADRTALVYVQFSGLSTLMAWDAEETRAALLTAQTALHDTMTACQGVLSEDGLQPLLTNKSGRLLTALNAQPADSVTRGRNVYVFSNDSSNVHPAMTFALAVQKRLLLEDWSEQVLNHELCEPLGDAEADLQHQYFHSVMQRMGSQESSARVFLDVPDCMPDRPASANGRQAVTSESGCTDMHSGVQQGPLSMGGKSNANLRTALLSQRAVSVSGSTQLSPASSAQTTPTWTTKLQHASRRTGGQSVFAEALSQLSLPRSSRGSGPGSGSFENPLYTGKAQGSKAGKKVLIGSGVLIIDSPGLRGLRIKVAVIRATRAACAVAIHSAGRAVFSGPPVKKAQRLLAKAKPGQIIVDRQLLAGCNSNES